MGDLPQVAPTSGPVMSGVVGTRSAELPVKA